MQTITVDGPEYSTHADLSDWLARVRSGLHEGKLAPYLGPGVLPSAGPVPASYSALADYFGKRVALPRRARGNLWAAAQYVESRKHRITAENFMSEAFSAATEPQPFHRFLACLPLPLIVDSWYDGGMRAALADRKDWMEVQGGSRAAIGETRWYRTYDSSGNEVEHSAANGATTVLYKPHGGAQPEKNFLVSDADYVEVLTEIDIQTPIPEVVKARRGPLGFVYLGCRFHDQTMRIFARQIAKRSEGPRFAVVDPSDGFTRNEERFLRELGAHVVVAPIEDVLFGLTA